MNNYSVLRVDSWSHNHMNSTYMVAYIDGVIRVPILIIPAITDSNLYYELSERVKNVKLIDSLEYSVSNIISEYYRNKKPIDYTVLLSKGEDCNMECTVFKFSYESLGVDRVLITPAITDSKLADYINNVIHGSNMESNLRDNRTIGDITTYIRAEIMNYQFNNW